MSIHLRIPKPCHEDWQSMQPSKEGRHCMACQKTVVDFSNMTDREILDYISKASGEVCGRVDRMQLNRGLKENNVRKRFSLMYAWNLLIVLFVFAGKAKAQGGVRYQKLYTVKKCPPKVEEDDILRLRVVHGIVKNAMTGEPVPFASVMLQGSQVGTSADSTGKFMLEVPVWGHETELEISALGFETATFTSIDSDKGEQVCNLSPVAKELKTFEVVNNCTAIRGGIRSYVVVSRWSKIAREVDALLLKKDVVIFPNPISAGNNIQAALQLKEKGEYRLDIIDAGGRVVWMRAVNINEAKYNLSIPTQTLWSAGVYWLRISGRHTKKIYNGKIVIQ